MKCSLGDICRMFLVLCSVFSQTHAFSVIFPDDNRIAEQYQMAPNDYDDSDVGRVDMQQDSEYDHVDKYLNVFKRYGRGWGHPTRFPWKRLPNTQCYRQHCRANRDCCREFNICDKSAKVCIDCWYGSLCRSERDCCMDYPFCKREWQTDPRTGRRYIDYGRCVDSLRGRG